MKPALVLQLEQHFNVTFEDAKTGSFYSTIGNTRVRVSDHFSKFTEKLGSYYERSVDILYAHDLNRAINYINSFNPFPEMKTGTTINHRVLGSMVFVSYNESNQTVVCDNGKTYFFDVFVY